MTDQKNNKIDFLVSVIMPAYNASKYISESISSVLTQTYSNLELIVIDDCSTDNTVHIVKKILQDEDRLSLIENKENSGPGISRNKGIKKSRGQYVAFLDSDDLWLKGKLNDQIEFMHSKNAAISFTSFRRFNLDDSDVGRLITVPDSLDYHGLLKNTAIATSTVVIDRYIVGEIVLTNVSKDYVEDYLLYYSVIKKCGFAFGLNKDLMRYRVVSNSFSRNKYKYAKKVWRTYRDIEGLNVFLSGYYFMHYAFRGVLKYAKF